MNLSQIKIIKLLHKALPATANNTPHETKIEEFKVGADALKLIADLEIVTDTRSVLDRYERL